MFETSSPEEMGEVHTLMGLAAERLYNQYINDKAFAVLFEGKTREEGVGQCLSAIYHAHDENGFSPRTRKERLLSFLSGEDSGCW
jgi:hypothetical protein